MLIGFIRWRAEAGIIMFVFESFQEVGSIIGIMGEYPRFQGWYGVQHAKGRVVVAVAAL